MVASVTNPIIHRTASAITEHRTALNYQTLRLVLGTASLLRSFLSSQTNLDRFIVQVIIYLHRMELRQLLFQFSHPFGPPWFLLLAIHGLNISVCFFHFQFDEQGDPQFTLKVPGFNSYDAMTQYLYF